MSILKENKIKVYSWGGNCCFPLSRWQQESFGSFEKANYLLISSPLTVKKAAYVLYLVKKMKKIKALVVAGDCALSRGDVDPRNIFHSVIEVEGHLPSEEKIYQALQS